MQIAKGSAVELELLPSIGLPVGRNLSTGIVQGFSTTKAEALLPLTFLKRNVRHEIK
jgi:hypothetical protein